MTSTGNVLIILPPGDIETVDRPDSREMVLDSSQVLLPRPKRFFIDRLSATGDLYVIPASCRQDWHDFEIRAEQTAETWPVPEWARPIDEMSYIEFECPTEVM